jgi:hypothetical protein
MWLSLTLRHLRVVETRELCLCACRYPWGGPLFFTHYSFLGLDPRRMQDRHAFYWMQNTRLGTGS